MDPQHVIAMALEIVLERERQNQRLMKESLRAQKVAVREKGRERSMLTRKKKGILAKEAARKKIVGDFMVFITATETNDLEIAQNFEEKEMMNTIATMMKSDAGDNGGFSGDYGGINLHGIELSVEEKAAIDAIVALENGLGCAGGANGGFAGRHGGINNAPEDAHNGKEDKMTATEGTKCDGGCEGSNAGDHGGNYNGNRGKYGEDGSQ